MIHHRQACEVRQYIAHSTDDLVTAEVVAPDGHINTHQHVVVYEYKELRGLVLT
jgi:hypothetical protein